MPLWIHGTAAGVCPAGFPHSEICGSMDMCSSPQLIAACHVFRRLSVPRHPPCALYSLTFEGFNLLQSLPLGRPSVVFRAGVSLVISLLMMKLNWFVQLCFHNCTMSSNMQFSRYRPRFRGLWLYRPSGNLKSLPGLPMTAKTVKKSLPASSCSPIPSPA